MSVVPKNVKRPFIPFEGNFSLQPFRLHAERILVEVMVWMRANEVCPLPVYDSDNLFLGMVSLKDILIFLEHEPEWNLYEHKLNYTLESLLDLKRGVLKELFITEAKL